MKNKVSSVDAYINSFPASIQILLREVRECILKNAPLAQESISYGMPAYKMKGKPLVYFAAFKNHIGFYATPFAHAFFDAALAQYKQGKGSVQFPIRQALPIQLIEEMVRFKVKQLQ